jgi:hypothetical protein
LPAPPLQGRTKISQAGRDANLDIPRPQGKRESQRKRCLRPSGENTRSPILKAARRQIEHFSTVHTGASAAVSHAGIDLRMGRFMNQTFATPNTKLIIH